MVKCNQLTFVPCKGLSL